jgi:hypothetical protein
MSSKIIGIKALLMCCGTKYNTQNIKAYNIAAIKKYFVAHRFLL